MALIKCEECKKEISDKAQQCIHCGNPVETSKECFECGNELSSNSFICDYCGYDNRTNNDPILKTTVNSKNNNFALTGMILGFSSIIAWIIPFFGFPCTIVGIVFSSKGLNSEKKSFAITGLVLCIVFLIVTLINSLAAAVITAKILNY